MLFARRQVAAFVVFMDERRMVAMESRGIYKGLPGGMVGQNETIDDFIRRHLRYKAITREYMARHTLLTIRDGKWDGKDTHIHLVHFARHRLYPISEGGISWIDIDDPNMTFDVTVDILKDLFAEQRQKHSLQPSLAVA